jgi:hypothetical protein
MPVTLVVALRAAPVSLLVSVTFAFTTAALPGSTTSPLIVPETFWPHSAAVKMSASIPSLAEFMIRLPRQDFPPGILRPIYTPPPSSGPQFFVVSTGVRWGGRRRGDRRMLQPGFPLCHPDQDRLQTQTATIEAVCSIFPS